MIVPIMLVMFFGTVEFSSGVAVDRKVTLMARTLSDLTSQSTVGRRYRSDQFLRRQHRDPDAVFRRRRPRPTISELYVDPDHAARRGCNGARRHQVDRRASRWSVRPVADHRDPALAVGGTYLIFSEVSYLYTPTVGYVMAKAGVTLSDVAYTRPRQSTCVYLQSRHGLHDALSVDSRSRTPQNRSNGIANRKRPR